MTAHLTRYRPSLPEGALLPFSWDHHLRAYQSLPDGSILGPVTDQGGALSEKIAVARLTSKTAPAFARSLILLWLNARKICDERRLLRAADPIPEFVVHNEVTYQEAPTAFGDEAPGWAIQDLRGSDYVKTRRSYQRALEKQQRESGTGFQHVISQWDRRFLIEEIDFGGCVTFYHRLTGHFLNVAFLTRGQPEDLWKQEVDPAQNIFCGVAVGFRGVDATQMEEVHFKASGEVRTLEHRLRLQNETWRTASDVLLPSEAPLSDRGRGLASLLFASDDLPPEERRAQICRPAALPRDLPIPLRHVGAAQRWEDLPLLHGALQFPAGVDDFLIRSRPLSLIGGGTAGVSFCFSLESDGIRLFLRQHPHQDYPPLTPLRGTLQALFVYAVKSARKHPSEKPGGHQDKPLLAEG